jgi:hypothetical protein
MAVTFQKRQKEMKRQEKQQMKQERRAQKKLANQENANQAKNGPPIEALEPTDLPETDQ